MPVYEYDCEACGPFTAMRPMADFAAPSDCPDCGAESPRVLITAPAIGVKNRSSFQAHAINERSAHEPRRSSGHGAGCGCCSGKSLALKGGKGQGSRSGAGAAEGAATQAAKSFPSARPWMISH